MIAEKSGREQLKKALQILSVGKKREDISIMKNSGIEKETDIIHLHCSYGNHQFYFEQENAYVFYKSETAKIIQQIIQAAEKIKKMDISMLCCVVMRSLYGSAVSRMRFLPQLTDICRMEKNWKNAEEKIFISQGLRESEE